MKKRKKRREREKKKKKSNFSHHPSQVKAHKFFGDINWEALQTEKSSLQPSFVPEIKDSLDTEYFDSERKWSLGKMTFMDGGVGGEVEKGEVFFSFFFFLYFV